MASDHADYMRGYRRRNPEYNERQKRNFERFRERNPTYFSEYNRKWREENAEKHRIHQREYKRRHPERRDAHNQARYIDLESACEMCGSTEKLEHHHPDYEQPSKTMTVCKSCHVNLHYNEKGGSESEQENGKD